MYSGRERTKAAGNLERSGEGTLGLRPYHAQGGQAITEHVARDVAREMGISVRVGQQPRLTVSATETGAVGHALVVLFQ